MRAFLLLALLLPGLAAAEAAAPDAPAAPAVDGVAAALSSSAEAAAMPVEPGPGAALHIVLKDGQMLDARLLKYDAYFLSVQNARGTHFDLPWIEVRTVESQEAPADLALMQGRLTADGGPVGSLVQARQPGVAFGKALWPGILLHGSGHRYAGDNDTFVSLVGGELFGLVVGGFGANELFGASKDGEHKDTALALTVGGGGIFALTWLWDLAFSPASARHFNQAHGLTLQPIPGGAQVALRF